MAVYQITDASPQRQYVAKNKPGIKAYADHIKDGQRKLFIMELLFLKKYGNLSKTIVYAGASPGYHLNRLIVLYPEHTWILYDPVDIKVEVLENTTVIIKHQYFTVEDAMKYQSDACLFISDIRSLNPRAGLRTEISKANKAVVDDMELQKKCIEAGKFVASSLKFRLPWKPEGVTTIEWSKVYTEYFDGELWAQPWTGEFSPELRLFVNNSPENIPVYGQANIYKKYYHKKIDDQMYYFNTITRRQDQFDDKYDLWVQRL